MRGAAVVALAILVPYSLAFVRVRFRPQVHFHPPDPSIMLVDTRQRAPRVGAIVLFRNHLGEEALGEVAVLERESLYVVAPGYPAYAIQTSLTNQDVIGHVLVRVPAP